MQIIENNPFRILGVWTNSPLRSLHANVTRMKAYLKVGKDISFPSDLTSFLPDITRSEALITQASASLNLSQDRIKYALFWFIEASSIDNVALGSLQKGDIDKAKNVLTKKVTFSSLINEAVIDFIQDNPEDAIRKLSSVIHTDSYRSDLVHAICGESFNIEELTLSQIFIEALNEELSIDVISSSLNDDDKELFHRIITDDLISKINNEIDASKGDRDDASFNITAGRKLMRNTKSSLTSLRSILGSANIKYKQTADDLANRILQCGINYFNASTGDKLVRVKNAKALQEYALSIAAGDIIKARCQENCDILNEIENTLPSYEVTNEDIAIRNILDKFSLDQDIIEAPNLIKACAPYLLKIKEILSASNKYYQRISSDIANAALELTVKKINEAVSNIDNEETFGFSSDEEYRRLLVDMLISNLKTAWLTILYIEKLDTEPEFKSNRLKPNKDSLYKLIDQLRGWGEGLRFDPLRRKGWAEGITANDLDMRTSEEVWPTCKSESSYKDFYERFPQSPHADEAKNKFLKLKSEREDRIREEKKKENELLERINNCSTFEELEKLKSVCKTTNTRKAVDDRYYSLCRRKQDFKQYCAFFGSSGSHYKDAQKAGKTAAEYIKENKGWATFIGICLVVLVGVGLIWGPEGYAIMFSIFAFICLSAAFGKGDAECGTRLIALCLAAVFGLIAYGIAQAFGL